MSAKPVSTCPCSVFFGPSCRPPASRTCSPRTGTLTSPPSRRQSTRTWSRRTVGACGGSWARRVSAVSGAPHGISYCTVQCATVCPSLPSPVEMHTAARAWAVWEARTNKLEQDSLEVMRIIYVRPLVCNLTCDVLHRHPYRCSYRSAEHTERVWQRREGSLILSHREPLLFSQRWVLIVVACQCPSEPRSPHPTRGCTHVP